MRDQRPPAESEQRRLLAVQRVPEGYSTEEVAEFLDVDPRSVRRRVAAYVELAEVGAVEPLRSARRGGTR